MKTAAAATLAHMPDPNEPKTPLRQRMDALGINPSDLRRLTGMSRTTIYKALDGEEVSPGKLREIEDALTYAERNPGDIPAQPGAVQEADDGSMIEFEVNVDAIGVRVVVRGAIENAEELEQQAAKLIRDMRTGRD